MRTERVTRSEVYQAVRASGSGDMGRIEAVVLESDGSLSVVTSGTDSGSALEGVTGAPSAG